MVRGKGRAKYKDEYAEQVYGLRALKLSNREIAQYFNTNESTIRVWIHRYPEFKERYISGNPNNIKVKHFSTTERLVNEINKALENDELHKFVEKVKSGDECGFEETLKEYTLKSINDKKLLNIVNSFEKLQKAQRQTLGIVDDDKLTRQDKLKETRHKQDMDNKKLELEEKKNQKETNYEIKIGFEDDEEA